MTVTGTDPDNIYEGDGNTVAFAFNFGVFETSEVVVVLINETTGVPVVQSETSQYTVSATNNDYWLSPGGTVTMVTAPTATEKLYIYRVPPLTQAFDVNAAPTMRDVSTTSTENALDKIVAQIQYLNQRIDRCIKIPINESSTTELANEIDRASGYVAMTASGDVTTTPGTSETTVHTTWGAAWAGLANSSAGLKELLTIDHVLVSDYSNDVDNAINAMDTNSVLVIDVSDGNAVMSASKTLSATQRIMFMPDCWVSGTGSPTLTINSPGHVMAGENEQVFDPDTVTVEFTKGGTVPARWWGALGDDSNDDSTAIQAAIDSLPSGGAGTEGTGGIVLFSPGIYVCNTGLDTNGHVVNLMGNSVPNTVLKKGLANTLLTCDSSFTNQTIRGIRFDGDDLAGGPLVKIEAGTSFWSLLDVQFLSNGGTTADSDAALHCDGPSGGTIEKANWSGNVRSAYINNAPNLTMKKIAVESGSVYDDFELSNFTGLRIDTMIMSEDGDNNNGGMALKTLVHAEINHVGLEHNHSVNPITVDATCRGVSITNIKVDRTGTSASSKSSILLDGSSFNVSITDFTLLPTVSTGAHTGGWIEINDVTGVSLTNICAINGNAAVTAEDLIKTSGGGSHNYISIDNVTQSNCTPNADLSLNADYLTIRNCDADITIETGSTDVFLENCTGTLTDQTLGATKATNALQTNIRDLSNAQIKALAGTPIELVAAPGSGKIIEFVSAMFFLDYGSEVLAEPSAPDDLAIEYDDGTGHQIWTDDTTGFITSSADALMQANASGLNDGASAITATANVNKNIVVLNTGGNYTGNASNDTTIRIVVTYRVWDQISL